MRDDTDLTSVPPATSGLHRMGAVHASSAAVVVPRRRQALRDRCRRRRARSRGAARRMLRPARPERRRQDDDDRDSRGPARRRMPARSRCSGGDGGPRRAPAAPAPRHPAAGNAAGRQAHGRGDAAAVPIVLSRAARPSTNCSTSSNSARSGPRGWGSCRADRSSGCRWRARWPAVPSCCFSTSRPPGSIRSRAASCGRCSSASAERRHHPDHDALHGRSARACATASASWIRAS